MGSLSSTTVTCPLIREALWITQKAHNYASIKTTTGIYNKESGTAYCKNKILVRNFIQHFCPHLTHTYTCRPPPPPPFHAQ